MILEKGLKWSHKHASEKYDAVVIGGGLSGMGVAGLLARAGKKVVLVERGSSLGGKTRSIKMDGFIFDIGPHVMQEKGFTEELTDLLGKREELHKIRVPFIENNVKLAFFKDGKWCDLYSIAPSGPEIEKVNNAIAAIRPEDFPNYDKVSVGDWLKGIT